MRTILFKTIFLITVVLTAAAACPWMNGTDAIYAQGIIPPSALIALPWLPKTPCRLVDLGSGAGFPGLVLAAARPDLDVWLLEPRARRAAFLAAAARRMRLAVRVVGARVAAPLPHDFPDRIDRLTVRALRLDPRAWRALLGRLAPDARLLSWSGDEALELPAEWTPSRALRTPGGEHRWLRDYRVAEVGA